MVIDPLLMKKILSLITVFGAVFALLSAQADPFTGFYKLSVTTEVEDRFDGSVVFQGADGEWGSGKVFTNSNGKLRFSGFLTGYDYDEVTGDAIKERISLVGIVNPTTGKVRLIKIGGELVSDLAAEENLVLNIKIIKRADVVVGLTGSGSASESYDWDTGEGVIRVDIFDVIRVTGYKTRELPVE